MFHISSNKFEGQVPDFGNHLNLLRLLVSQNSLGSNSENDLLFLTSLKHCSNLEVLDIGYNNFGGFLSNSTANLSVKLSNLYFGGNQLTGVVPADLGVENNFFTGVIPSHLGKFQKLQGLNLWRNRLSGQIPTSLGNLTQLSQLIVGQNKLEGNIPSAIGNCTSLNVLVVAQ